MHNNQDILKQRYGEYRYKMKSAKTRAERLAVKKEMSEFLRSVAEQFGQEVVNKLVRKNKKHG